MSAKAGTDIFEIRNSTVSATKIYWEYRSSGCLAKAELAGYLRETLQVN